ncbi:PREDICTED: transmembrane protein 217-like [Chrysochloris asiatica]|uniref:Transmembrane protein 217-like n=1 Tax=Chrysochloris asiatica TaxID=185453 RepID=A0A9B0WK61_CHRAS|nr:PREDICTED: transmembrane protein 217-like [Chrysochloris asiatica]
MREQHWCGMTPKIGTVLSGAFTIISTDMYLIFEEKYIKSSNCPEVELRNQGINNIISQYFRCWTFEIAFFMSLATIIISFLLLYSVYAQIFRGMMIYIIWIFLYESVSIIIQVLTNSNSALEAVRVIRWFGLVSRIFMHCFWMFYVITYMQIIYKSKSQGNILYNRRFSVGVREFPRRKSKSFSITNTINNVRSFH